MIKKTFVLFVSFSLLAFAGSLVAQEKKASDSKDGIVAINEKFKIFPIDKAGNSVYLEDKKLFSDKGLILKTIREVPSGYVYLGVTEAGDPQLGFIGEDSSKFRDLGNGFYFLKTSKWKSKILRISSKNEITDLLPRSNTASGLVYNGKDKAVFSHIAKGETIETEDGKQRYQYTLKLHVVNLKTDQISHLKELIDNFSPNLRLKWVDDNHVQYKLSDNQTKIIRVN